MLLAEQLLCGKPKKKNLRTSKNFRKKALNLRTTTSIYADVRLGCHEAGEQALFYRTTNRWPMVRNQKTTKRLKPEIYI